MTDKEIDVLISRFQKRIKELEAIKARRLSTRKKSDLFPEDSFRNNSLCRKVQCIETGQIFDSIRQASRLTKCSAPEISLCCRGIQEKVKGFSWKYLF